MALQVTKRHVFLGYLPILSILLVLGLLINTSTGVFAATNLTYFSIAVTVTANAPIVYNVTPGVITPISAGNAELTIVFNVTDADGVGDLDNARAAVNITLAGVTRQNNSENCEVVVSSFSGGTDRSYSCIVVIRYHDNSSEYWKINATISDGTSTAFNQSLNATVNSLSAMTTVSSSLATSQALGASNVELIFVLNNTGNFNFTELNLTPYDLNATETDFFKLGGETSGTRGSANFSINLTQSGTSNGFGVGLLNNTHVNLSENYETDDAGLSIFLGPATGQNTDNLHANRSIYIYIDLPNDKGLSTGVTYNTSQPSLWRVLSE